MAGKAKGPGDTGSEMPSVDKGLQERIKGDAGELTDPGDEGSYPGSQTPAGADSSGNVETIVDASLSPQETAYMAQEPSAMSIASMPIDFGRRANMTFTYLEEAVKAALSDDLRVSRDEAVMLIDAAERTKSSNDQLIALVAKHAIEIYEKIVANNPQNIEERRKAATNAMLGILDATDLFPEEKYSRNNAFQVVRKSRLLKDDIELFPELKDELVKFEEIYKREGLGKKIVGVAKINASRNLGMHLPLIEMLNQIYHTISDDLYINPNEMEVIQRGYEASPVTKYELIFGLIRDMELIIPQIESDKEHTLEEKSDFKKSAIESIINVAKGIERKNSDMSRESDWEREIYAFGISHEREDLVAEYRKAFSRADHIGEFLDSLQMIIKDWKIEPHEYKVFTSIMESMGVGFEEALGYTRDMLIARIRETHEKDPALANSMKLSAMDMITTLMIYRLGELPSKENMLTRREYALLGDIVYRINNSHLSHDGIEAQLKNPEEKNRQDYKMPEWCRKRFKQRIAKDSRTTSMEREIQEEIRANNIITALTGLKYDYAVNLLANDNNERFVPYIGQKLYKTRDIDLVVAQILGGTNGDKICLVRRGIGNDSYICVDEETGLIDFNIGEFRVLQADGNLSAKVEKSYKMQIDPNAKDPQTILFVPETITHEPKEKVQDKPKKIGYYPLDLEVNTTFEALGMIVDMKSAVGIVGFGPQALDIDDLPGYQRGIDELLTNAKKDPKKTRLVTINRDIMMAQRIYLPMRTVDVSTMDYHTYQMTSYYGAVALETVPGGVIEQENGTIRIPISKAYIMSGINYDKTALEKGILKTNTCHAGSSNPEKPTMFLEIGLDRSNRDSYGVRLKFKDAPSIMLNHLPEAIYTGNRNAIDVVGPSINHIPKN